MKRLQRNTYTRAERIKVNLMIKLGHASFYCDIIADIIHHINSISFNLINFIREEK